MNLYILHIFKGFIGLVSNVDENEVESESEDYDPKKKGLIEFVEQRRNSCRDVDLKYLSYNPYILNVCQNCKNNEKHHKSEALIDTP